MAKAHISFGKMESFTVNLNIETKSWTVTGSVLGLKFIEDKDVTQKFIQFCSDKHDKYGLAKDGSIIWKTETIQSIALEDEEGNPESEVAMEGDIQDKEGDLSTKKVQLSKHDSVEDSKQSKIQCNENLTEEENLLQTNSNSAVRKSSRLKNKEPKKFNNMEIEIEGDYNFNGIKSEIDEDQDFNGIKSEIDEDQDFNASCKNKEVLEGERNFECSYCKLIFITKAEHTSHNIDMHKNVSDDDIIPERTDLCCDLCNRQFLSGKQLKKHKQRHSSKKSVTCPLCKNKFYNEQSVKKHLKKIHQELRPCCFPCQSLFESESVFTKHKLQNICLKKNIASVQCKTCGKHFMSIKYLYTHKKLVHGLKVSICRFCTECFDKREDLSYHLETQHKTTTTCEGCRAIFETDLEFNKHLNDVHKDRVIRCSQCSDVFFKKRDFETHMEEHTNGSRFICAECGKGFIHKMSFNRHMISHSSMRPHQCESCGMCFKLPSTLRLHLRTHVQDKKYKCVSCDREFRSTEGLKNHKIKYHMTEEELKSYKNKIYTCDHCGKKTGQKHVHVRHVRSHTGEKPFECSECVKSFPTNSALNVHRKTHVDKNKLLCVTCGMSFWNKSHFNRHIDSKKHRCLVAKQKQDLNKQSSIQENAEQAKNTVIVLDNQNQNFTTEFGNNAASSLTCIIIPENFQNVHLENFETVGNNVDTIYLKSSE
ncbi:KRAB [Mytilus coruscus]|uniref:KRAB n=1 Tax=Mytilus coruscus TaxID=42192 RepID=A0A6J8BX55_MYTCO|nr:KRAB [Mytilus coruscus]